MIGFHGEASPQQNNRIDLPEHEPVHFGRVSGFLVNIIGTSRSAILDKSAKVRQAALGASVITAPVLLAIGVSVFSVRTLHLSPARAIPIALVAAVLLMPVELGLASTLSSPKFLKRLSKIGWRALLLACSAFVFSEAIGEWVFDSTVRTNLATIVIAEQHQRADQVRASADENPQISALQNQQAAMQTEITNLEADKAAAQSRVQQAQALVDAEIAGKLGGRAAGCGLECNRKIAELDQARSERDRVFAADNAAITDRQSHITSDDAKIGGLRSAVDLRVASEVAKVTVSSMGFAERFRALNEGTFGAGNWDLLVYRLAISGFLFFLEGYALFFKLGGQSEHDRLVLEASAREVTRRTELGAQSLGEAAKDREAASRTLGMQRADETLEIQLTVDAQKRERELRRRADDEVLVHAIRLDTEHRKEVLETEHYKRTVDTLTERFLYMSAAEQRFGEPLESVFLLDDNPGNETGVA